MARTPSFPTPIINVRDVLPSNVTSIPEDTLHKPLFWFYAEKGPKNVASWGSGSDHTTMYGSATFNENSAYFNHQTLFAARAMAIQGTYGVRVVPDDAAVAGMVLEMWVTETAITQYAKNPDGSRTTDEEGDPLPLKESDGVTVVTEPGVRIQFNRRALTTNEVYNGLSTSTSAGTTKYPLIATYGEYEGAYVNSTGFRLYYSTNYDKRQVADVGALTYRFEPMEVVSGATTASSLRDIYGSNSLDVSLQAQTIDPKTSLDISLTGTISNRYTDSNGINLLPYKVHVYSDHVQTVATLVKSKSPELGADFSIWMINLLSALDENGHPYDHLEVTNQTTTVSPNVILYNTGGSNGTMSLANFESAIVSYLSGTVYPEIRDNFRFPFTHIYDSGFTLDTKFDMMSVFGLSDAVVFDLSTQDVSLDFNTQAEDLSTGTALRQRVALNTESVLEGVGHCRSGIYAQAGRLASNRNYTKPVPATLDRLIKRCLYDGGTYRKGTPKGRPASEVTVISNINWTPTNDDQRQEAWDNAINYIMYADRTTLFYPDLRSTYAFDNSLLSSSTLVDAIVYVKHIIRQVWTQFVGIEMAPTILFSQIEETINTRINRAFNGSIGVSTTLYQTEASNALGYAVDATVQISASPANRVWNVTIPVVRADSTTTA